MSSFPFFRSNACSPARIADAFASEATVVDEGEDTTVVGREAIHGLMTDITSKHKTTLKATGLAEKDGESVVTAHVSGNFDGSPAEFVYRFGLIDRLVVEFVVFK